MNGVSLSLPSLPLEGGNVSLRCSWSAGSEVSVVWGKNGAVLSSDSHITISAGSLLINQARRDDAGEYTCTVSNAVSAQTTKTTLSVFCESITISAVSVIAADTSHIDFSSPEFLFSNCCLLELYIQIPNFLYD